MKKFFVRIFFDETYVTYYGEKCLEINMKDVSNVKGMLRVALDGRKVLTSISELSNIELDKYYYIFIYNVIILVGRTISRRQIILDNLDFNTVFSIDCSINFDTRKNVVTFSKPIYIGFKKYSSGDYYYCKNTVFCINGVQFTIDNDTMYVEEYFKNINSLESYCENNAISTTEKTEYYEKSFTFDMQFLKFEETIWKYLVTPVATLITMGTISFLTKRQGMIYFMLASVVSTTVASTLTYYMQKVKVKYHNNMVNCKFNELKDMFLKKMYSNDLQRNKDANYNLYNQESLTLGYILSDERNISFKVSENELEEQFVDSIQKLPSFYKRLSIVPKNFELSIYGEYKNIYLNNLLYQMCNNGIVSNIVVLGDIYLLSSLKWLADITFISDSTEISYHSFNNKTLLVITEDYFSFKFPNNTNMIGVIFYFYKSYANNNVEVNREKVNVLIKQDDTVSSASLFTFMEINLLKLDLIIRKRVFADSSFVKSVLKGLEIGEEYSLDVEKYGPHGIIVGMTGSGKTVLLQSMILAIAKNYTPTQAVICIIDFKGDALVNLVRGIPHICSTYSNLDCDYDNVVRSIESEIEFRQRELRTSGLSEYNDIRFKKTFPKLFIFIDEFAELKNSSSLIIERLISIARVGRSLGVYLVLSLQKSSGVVSEQLKSNLGYRICLKVNTKQESNEMIYSDEAFFLSKPGQAIVNLGTHNTQIQVLNCNDFVKDRIIIDGKNSNSITYFDRDVSKLKNTYKKTSYVVWKSFPKYHLPGIILNDPYSKVFDRLTPVFDNYIVVGENDIERLSLVETIVTNLSCTLLYLGTSNTFSASLRFKNLKYLEIYLRLAMTKKDRVVLVIDKIEHYGEEKLIDIVNKIIDNVYENVKVIICSRSVNTSVSRVCKKIGNKLMLRHLDTSDVYNLFFKRTDIVLNQKNVGICLHNGKLITFKNYYNEYKKMCRKVISLDAKYIKLSTCQEYEIKNALIIFDTNTFGIDSILLNSLDNHIKLDCNYLIHYSKVNNSHIPLLHNFSSILIATKKFELNFRKFPIYDNMLYELLSDDHIIITKYLDYY